MGIAVVVLLAASCSSSAHLSSSSATSTTLEQSSAAIEDQLVAQEPAGTQHLHYSYGPIPISPGQNSISFSGRNVPKPDVDGYILRIAPNIRRADGSVPRVDVLHLHHGVWLNQSAHDATDPRLPERFFAAGEEKTTMELPTGFGYAYKANDKWTINYMLHDLTPDPDSVSITYDIDFLPMSAPSAKTIRAARPLWMDVQNGSVYPVFDVTRGSGTNGTFTYPDQANDPYKGGAPLNQWTVDRDMVLVATAGHLHPGGLHDDLWVDRAGSTAHLFESDTRYYEPAGAVSWDVAMTATDPDWRASVHPGDVLRISTTYDSARASWYESMGIMVVWAAEGADGPDPFTTDVARGGHLTHGHLPENDNHGGAANGEVAAYSSRPTTPAPNGAVSIADFTYGAGDLTLKVAQPIPVVTAGQTLTFRNDDEHASTPIWHTITACKSPCDGSTGIAYPLADGDVQFDSGQLGTDGPPSAGTLTWSTPADLPAGTYTYFCRIHPFMRGAFEVAN